MIRWFLLSISLLLSACERAPKNPPSADQPRAAGPGTVWDARVPGVYGHVGVSEATGDVGGLEIVIQCTQSQCLASVTMDEGSPQPPVEAPATVRDTTVDINMPAGNRLSGMGTFHGVVTQQHLIGAFSNGVEADLTRHGDAPPNTRLKLTARLD